MKKVSVNTDKPYEVVIGHDLTAPIAATLSNSVNKVAVIYAEIMRSYVAKLSLEIQTHHPDIKIIPILAPESESAKSLDFVGQVWDELGNHKFTRSDLVISVGGGATTDVAGFIAATWLRGIGVIHIPSTLLGMVDAAVGGKTGINTKAGKNLVGSFHHPLSVWCDFDLLISLPAADLRAGFAEIVKCGFIEDSIILEIIEQEGNSILSPQNAKLIELVERAIAVKARVVAQDFKEDRAGGLGREILNYGHTFGHAIENIENYSWRHGDAISVGMMFVAYLSHKLGVCNQSLVDRQLAILQLLALPVSYQGDFSKLLDVMSVDKKSRGNVLRFIGLEDFGSPVVITSPSVQDLQHAFRMVSGD